MIVYDDNADMMLSFLLWKLSAVIWFKARGMHGEV